jgi:predicted DNA-binding protein (MmcQ/YjbR family)
VTAAVLKRHCLALAGAAEDFPFSPGTSVFKVRGKVFAITRLESRPLKVSLKCEPGLAEQLRATYGEIEPGYHLNKRHWNTVTLDGTLPATMVRDMIEDSYDLVVAGLPRRVRDELGWAPES